MGEGQSQAERDEGVLARIDGEFGVDQIAERIGKMVQA